MLAGLASHPSRAQTFVGVVMCHIGAYLLLSAYCHSVYRYKRVYTIGEMDWWTGLVDCTTGLIDFHLKRTFRGSIMRCNGGK